MGGSNERFDGKWEVIVLGSWPESRGRWAALYLRGKRMDPFVAAYGYDPETETWSQGRYFRTAAAAWNHADPEIAESLSEPVTFDGLKDSFEEMTGRRLSDEGVREYADDCVRAIGPDYGDSAEELRGNALDWNEWHGEEVCLYELAE